MRGVLFASLAASCVMFPVSGRSEQPLSIDQMMNALTPKVVAKKCTASNPCRGIRAEPSTAEDYAPDQAAVPRIAHEAHRMPATGTGSLDLTIEFPSGSAELTPSAARVLARLGQALTNPRLAGYKFRIEGHTDTMGLAAENQALSEKRATSVAGYLESSFGIAPERLQPVGMGETELAVPTADQTADLRNRRVHIVNLGRS